jgi:hypothetical protein
VEISFTSTSDSSGLAPYVMNLGDYTVSTPNNPALRVLRMADPQGEEAAVATATKV